MSVVLVTDRVELAEAVQALGEVEVVPTARVPEVTRAQLVLIDTAVLCNTAVIATQVVLVSTDQGWRIGSEEAATTLAAQQALYRPSHVIELPVAGVWLADRIHEAHVKAGAFE